MARPSAPSSSTFSVIGADVAIKGDVSASSELHVDGRIEGDIACESLVQGESSVIEGAISAETARLAGKVSGSITARQLVVLKSARVEGDVHYDALTIEQGAQVEGRFAHRMPSQRSTDKPAAPVASDDGEPKLTLAT
ncbi:bactofilin family protein [Pelagerythrobacter rhizovicinus]|uniref:Polymer-forming cytoskeletal protein n=1 Tax=Pelagerythrobacter rhizovicinus TaxID=2268576 RepID=A0A4Q2KHV2_9SPHN|nr:polymer-forming cytoskeletal protein [Pelagerythrobacter rhizovicinus]RXZ64734.1 polymer-forming cytoskeletal protein [Pelagerythrobacter rhizovicinus]